MSTLTRLNQSLQSVYESGNSTYCRSVSCAFAPAAIPIFRRVAANAKLPFDPELIPIHELDADGAHEAQRPTEAAIDKVADLLPVDAALLSDEEFTLAELGRVGLLCGMERQVEIPDVRHLPDWAEGLPWEREAEVSVPGYCSEPEPDVYTYEADEIAFHHLVSFGLGKPSTLVSHAGRFADRKLYRPHTGLSDKGQRWLDLTPAILQAADTSLMMEAVFDESGEFENERVAIERALALLGEDERRYIDKRLRSEAVFSLLNGCHEDKKQRVAGVVGTKPSTRLDKEKRTDPSREANTDKRSGSLSMGMS